MYAMFCNLWIMGIMIAQPASNENISTKTVVNNVDLFIVSPPCVDS